MTRLKIRGLVPTTYPEADFFLCFGEVLGNIELITYMKYQNILMTERYGRAKEQLKEFDKFKQQPNFEFLMSDQKNMKNLSRYQP